MQQGRYAGRAIRERLRGREPAPFHYRDKGNLATIGRAKAVADIKGLQLSGFIAWLTWLLVHLFYLIGFQNRLLVFTRWVISFVTRGRGERLITTEHLGGEAEVASGPVAYDEQLAERIRELLAAEPELTEKRMFGGLAFLVNGNMAVAASGQGGLLVRVDPAESATLVGETPARVMEMRGREMPGWLRLDSDELRTQDELSTWVQRGLAFGRSLPAKR
jgi:TfoX/Sxy family transcriptional regulator of competence genes